MAEGNYAVNPGGRKDLSYKNFICALLAFLAMLALISLLLFVLGNKSDTSKSLAAEAQANSDSQGLYSKTTPKLITTKSPKTTNKGDSTEPPPTTKITIELIREGSPAPIILTSKTTVSAKTETTTLLTTTSINPNQDHKDLNETTTSNIAHVTSAPVTGTTICIFEDENPTTTEEPTTPAAAKTASIPLCTTKKVGSTSPIRTTTTTTSAKTTTVESITDPPTIVAIIKKTTTKPTTTVKTTTVEPTTEPPTTTSTVKTTTTIPTTTTKPVTKVPILVPVKKTTTAATTTDEPTTDPPTTVSTIPTTTAKTTTVKPTTNPPVTIILKKVPTTTTVKTTTIEPTTEPPTTIVSTVKTTKAAPTTTPANVISTVTTKPTLPIDVQEFDGTTSTTQRTTTDNNPNTISKTTQQKTTTVTKTTYTYTTTTKKKGNGTCIDGVCKRAASVMLSKLNHDETDDSAYCEDYYDAICKGYEPNHDDDFFLYSFKKFADEIQKSNDSNQVVFNEFYHNCINFGKSINRIHRAKYLNGLNVIDVTETVAKAILTQSMPFFDVGLNILDDKFIIEVTLPHLSYLPTSIKGWPLAEQLKENCIVEIGGSTKDNVVEFQQITQNIDLCVKDITKGYVNQFLDEVSQLKTATDMDHLENILTNADKKKDALLETLDKVQDSLTQYRNEKDLNTSFINITLADLTAKYDLGVDWSAVFKSCGTTVDGNTVIYFSKYLEEVFKELANKKESLKDMLDLWYNIQFYKNVVIENQIGNRGHYCINIASRLMPDVASYVIADMNNDKPEYDLVNDVMEKLRERFNESLSEAGFTPDSVNIMQERLDGLELIKPQKNPITDDSYKEIKGVYPEQINQLLEHHTKMLLDQFSKPVTAETLLTLFVYAFDKEPKTFPPNKEIVYQPGFTYEMSKHLPEYIRLAKQGLPLAEEISKHFVKNDFVHLDPKEEKIYDDLFKSLDTKYLIDKTKYNIENIESEVEDASGKNLDYESIVEDNMAFRLVSDVFLKKPKQDALPFLVDYTVDKTFISVALQDFCKTNNLADFIGDFYNMRHLPAPIRVRNIVSNSEFFEKTYNCKYTNSKKQFPFIN